MQDDSLNNKSMGRGGKRPGAGRKKGKQEPHTVERAKVLEAFRARVSAQADRLFDAQFSLATGVSLLFRVDKDSKGHDKPAVQVTDPGEVEDFIDGNTSGDGYYYITTRMPDNRAIDSMLDRTFGKPEAHLDLTSKGKRIQAPAIVSEIARRTDAEPEAEATTSN